MREILYYCNNCETNLWIMETKDLEDEIRCPDCLEWSAKALFVEA